MDRKGSNWHILCSRAELQFIQMKSTLTFLRCHLPQGLSSLYVSSSSDVMDPSNDMSQNLFDHSMLWTEKYIIIATRGGRRSSNLLNSDLQCPLGGASCHLLALAQECILDWQYYSEKHTIPLDKSCMLGSIWGSITAPRRRKFIRF